MIRALLVVSFWSVYVVAGALIGLPVTFVTQDLTFIWNLAMKCARWGVRLGGVRVKGVGLEQLDEKTNYLYMSNHVSNLDPPIIVPLLGRQIAVLAKKEIFRIPVLGAVLRTGGVVPVDRSNRKAAIESVRDAVRVLQSGRSMLVYPEGTRSRDGKLLPFKKGPFHMASEAGVAIVPVTMLGTYEAWPKGKFAIHPGEVTVVFHHPIDPAQYTTRDALMTAVRESIESALPAKFQSVERPN